jgi:hypothetical protein
VALAVRRGQKLEDSIDGDGDADGEPWATDVGGRRGNSFDDLWHW